MLRTCQGPTWLRPELKGARIAARLLARVLRLTLLAPDIVEAILDGRQAPELTLARVLESFPVDWADQPRTH